MMMGGLIIWTSWSWPWPSPMASIYWPSYPYTWWWWSCWGCSSRCCSKKYRSNHLSSFWRSLPLSFLGTSTTYASHSWRYISSGWTSNKCIVKFPFTSQRLPFRYALCTSWWVSTPSTTGRQRASKKSQRNYLKSMAHKNLARSHQRQPTCSLRSPQTHWNPQKSTWQTYAQTQHHHSRLYNQ